MNTQRAIVVTVALCGFLLTALPSYAGLGAQLTPATQRFGSGEWGATPSTTSMSFGTQTVSDIYFTVTNTGTLPLTGATYTLSGSALKTGMTLSLLGCVGGNWDMTTGACTGGVVQTIVTTTGTATSASVTPAGLVPVAIGASVTLDAQLSRRPARTTVGSVTVTVDRSQVRAAAVTNA